MCEACSKVIEVEDRSSCVMLLDPEAMLSSLLPEFDANQPCTDDECFEKQAFEGFNTWTNFRCQ